MSQTLHELFYDPRTGLSRNGFIKRATALGFKSKGIDEFLKKQEATQINKEATTQTYFPLWGRGAGSYQMDLMFADKRTILNIINVNSRFLYSYLLKDKSLKSVLPALAEFIEEAEERSPCMFLQSDNGKEFKNTKVKALLKEHEIEQNFVEVKDHRGQGMVERVNGTLRLLFKLYEDAFKQSWTVGFKDLVWNYNHRMHSSIKQAPADADDDAGLEARQKQYDEAQRELEKFKVGSQVRKRIVRSDAGFEKGKTQWSAHTFRIDGIVHNMCALSDRTLVSHNDLQLISGVESLKTTQSLAELNAKREHEKKVAKHKRAMSREGLNFV